MKISKVFFLGLGFFIALSCSDNSIKPQEAETLIKNRLSKMPGRSVSFYLGVITDENYLPVYRAISTGKYLTIKDDVFIKEAGKKMTLFEATKEGEEIFKCDKNRCTVEICQIVFDKFISIVNKGRFATANYQIKTVCDENLYNIFKPLAEKQYIKPETVKEKADFEFSKDGWKIK